MPGHYEENKKKLNRALGMCTEDELPKLEKQYYENLTKEYKSYGDMLNAEVETNNELKLHQADLKKLDLGEMYADRKKRADAKQKEIDDVFSEYMKTRNDEQKLKDNTINKKEYLVFASPEEKMLKALQNYIDFTFKNDIYLDYNGLIEETNAKRLRNEKLTPAESEALKIANQIVSYREEADKISVQITANHKIQQQLKEKENNLSIELKKINSEDVKKKYNEQVQYHKDQIQKCQNELTKIELYRSAKAIVDSAQRLHKDSIHVTRGLKVVKQAREDYIHNHGPFARFFGHIFTFMDAHKEHVDYLRLKQDLLDQVENKDPNAAKSLVDVSANDLQTWLHGKKGPLDELVRIGEEAISNGQYDKTDVNYKRFDYSNLSDNDLLNQARKDMNYLLNIQVLSGYKSLGEGEAVKFDDNTHAKWMLDILVQVKQRGDKTGDPRFENLFNELDKSRLKPEEITNALLPDNDPNKKPFRDGNYYTDGFLETYEIRYFENGSEAAERARIFRQNETAAHKEQRLQEEKKIKETEEKDKAEIERNRRKEHPELFKNLDFYVAHRDRTLDISENADYNALAIKEQERIDKFFNDLEKKQKDEKDSVLEDNSDDFSLKLGNDSNLIEESDVILSQSEGGDDVLNAVKKAKAENKEQNKGETMITEHVVEQKGFDERFLY